MPALLGALLVPVAVGGCGGSGASKASVTARAHTAAGQYAALASFGHPAATSERAEIAGRLRAFLAATANGNAAKRCRLLAGATRARVGTMFARTHQSCRRVLGAVAARLTARQRAELTTARLTAVRIEGNHGYALYRTTADARNVIPLLRERGSWGIAALAGTSL